MYRDSTEVVQDLSHIDKLEFGSLIQVVTDS